MKSEQINTILLLLLVYLIMKKDKTKETIEQQMKRAESIGMAKTIGELGTTF